MRRQRTQQPVDVMTWQSPGAGVPQPNPPGLLRASVNEKAGPDGPACAVNTCSHRLPLGELERATGPLAAVLLALLHPAVARQVPGVAELLGDAPLGCLGVGRGGRLLGLAEHRLESPGDALRRGTGLAGDAAAADMDEDVEPVANLEEARGPVQHRQVLLLRHEL